MESEDDIWRLVILALFAVAGIAWFLGGIFTPVAGRWRDDDGVEITLTQVGPRLRGRAELSGGFQIFRGWALWGRIRLQRADWGIAHLTALGFSAEQAGNIEGRTTGHLELTRQNGELAGVFFGRKFSFEDDRVRSVPKAQSTSRVWKRLV